MGDIFVQDFAGPPSAKNLPMIKKVYQYGNFVVELYFSVLGMHRAAEPNKPAFLTRYDFTDFNTTKAVNVPWASSGTIYFLLRITYRILNRGSGLEGPTFSLGLVNYRCSFDYAFAEGKDGDDKELTFDAPETMKDDYEDHDMADDRVELSSWNPVIGSKGKFLRISPVVSLPGISATSAQSIQVGRDLGKVKVQGTVQGGGSVSEPQSPSSGGSFRLDVYITAKPYDGPTSDFVDDMAVRVFYSENESTFTPARKATVLAWVTKMNRKYPDLADAVRNGELMLYVDGFASKTGSPERNQQIAIDRLTPVKAYIATQLALPANKLSPKPYGSQFAAWEWNFDVSGGAVKSPQATDRVVKAWFDPNAAWKIIKKKAKAA